MYNIIWLKKQVLGEISVLGNKEIGSECFNLGKTFQCIYAGTKVAGSWDLEVVLTSHLLILNA
jgi:hypothetical protein